MWHTLTTYVGDGKGDHGTDWSVVCDGDMTNKQAIDMCERLGRFFRTRLFRGINAGKLICESGTDKKTPVC